MGEKEKIIDFIEGRLSDSQRSDFMDWLQEDPRNKEDYFREKDLWDAYAMNTHKVRINIHDEWRVLENRIRSCSKPLVESGQKSLSFWIRIAAMLVIVFGLGWASNFIVDYYPGNTEISHQLLVPKGQRSKLSMADGTEIWLNSDSKLNFSDNLVKGERVVSLEGEAFFDVAKDKKHPFVLKTKGQVLRVLGTAFNVRSYGNDDKVITTLERGEVEVRACGRKVVLKPGQQLEWSRSTNRLKLKNVETGYYTVWRKGRYVFENENFDDLMRMVERWYDVKFHYPKNYFKNMHYSGVIKRTKPLEHVLSLINHTTPIHYEIKGDDVIIYPKNK